MDSSKKVNTKRQIQDERVPVHLREFISSISLKNAVQQDKKKRTAGKRRKSTDQEVEIKQSKRKGGHQFTELEIMKLWNSFKLEFPEGNINRPQLMELIRTIFPKCDADVVINNIFQVFDTGGTGKVVPTELLMAFSMSMKGSVEDKLHWTFKLYDKDGSGEIDPEEMEEIFTKLCKIVEGTEGEQSKRLEKVQEENQKKERERLAKIREDEANRSKDEMLNGKPADIELFSYRKKKLGKSNSVPADSRKNRTKKSFSFDEHKTDEGTVDDEDKVKVIQLVAKELAHPQRDCKLFDPGKRARELFKALDEDGNGLLTEDEFVQGCMSDEVFVKVLDEFCGDFIWGTTSTEL